MPTEYASLTVDVNTDGVAKAEKDLKKLTPAAKGAEKATDSFAKILDKMNADLKRQEAIIGKTADEIELYDAAVRGATQEDLKAIKAIQAKRNALKESSANVQMHTGLMGRMTSGFRVQKGAIQQSSYQLQDFAVQVAGGQGAMRAFTQQAPQFLSIFGPAGAVIGGIVAIGGALGGAFASGFFDATKATDELTTAIESLNDIITLNEDKVDVLSDSYAELAKRSTTLSQSAVKEALLKTADALNAANEEAKDLANSLSPNELGGRFDRISLLVGQFRSAFLAGSIDLETFNDKINRLFLQTEDPSKDFREVREEIAKIAEQARIAGERRDILMGGTSGLNTESEQKEIDEQRKKNDKLLDLQTDYEADLANKRYDAAQASIYTLEDSFRSKETILQDKYNQQLSLINAAETLKLDTEKNYEDLRVLNKRQYDERLLDLEKQKNDKLAAEAEKRRQIEMSADQAILQSKLGFTQQLGSILAQGAEEGSAAAKAGYAISQGIQVVQAINSANLAAAGQLAAYAGIPDPTGALLVAAEGRAETVRATGYATAALIAGNTIGTLAGRAQGGQVRGDQPYLVGEYGPEMFTPSSAGRITPNNQMGGNSGIEVINNIKVIGGSGNQEVTTSRRMISDTKMIQDIVIREMVTPNSQGRVGMSATSNLVNKGTR